MIDITTFGAVGDGKTMNTAAIQAAFNEEQIKECTHPIGIRPAQCLFFMPQKILDLLGRECG